MSTTATTTTASDSSSQSSANSAGMSAVIGAVGNLLTVLFWNPEPAPDFPQNDVNVQYWHNPFAPQPSNQNNQNATGGSLNLMYIGAALVGVLVLIMVIRK